MDELGDAVGAVARHFKLNFFFAFGVGAGVNVLSRYIRRKNGGDPDVRGLVSISPNLTMPGWSEWGFDKVVRAQTTFMALNMPSFIVDQSLNSFFSPQTHNADQARIAAFRQMLTKSPLPANYAAFESAWISRTDIVRALKVKPIKVPTLTFYGGNSNRVDHILDIAGSDGVFQSTRSETLEVWKCADFVHDEAPDTVLNAFKAMLQGYSIAV